MKIKKALGQAEPLENIVKTEELPIDDSNALKALM
jgi:hypothetical protein